MLQKLLLMKPWALFLFLFGIPFVVQVTSVGLVIASQNLNLLFIVFPITMALYVAVLLSWLYALSVNLRRRLPGTVQMNARKFNFCLFIPTVYTVVICGLMFSMFFPESTGIRPSSTLFFGVMPVHYFSIGCLVYCLYFNTKALKSVEMQRPVTFTDHLGEFFLLCIYPLGVWFIQPVVNRVLNRPPVVTYQQPTG